MKFSLIVVVLLILDGSASAEEWMGKVVKVTDGDTIVVLRSGKQVKIRLYGVDTPEKKQAFGQKAKEFTSKLVAGKMVRIEVKAKDRYGRTVGIVTWRDARGTDRPGVARTTLYKRVLNEELVQAGLAWWHKKYAPKDKKLGVLQAGARKAKRGLWVDKNPVAPWDWMRGARKTKGCSSTADCVVIECCCDWHVMRQGDSIPDPCKVKCDCGTIALKPMAACRKGKCLPVITEEASLHGNIRTKVFHVKGCQHFQCKNCTTSFTTAQAAISAGYRAHKACIKRTKIIPKLLKPPKPPWKDQRCKQNSDCVIAWKPCGYGQPPCKDTWKSAVNLQADLQYRKSWANKKPACHSKPFCKTHGHWLGSKAVCIEGQCAVRR